MGFVDDWMNHSMGSMGRHELQESDNKWDAEYEITSNSYVPEGTLLYRVHTGGGSEPELSDYDDRGEMQTEIFKTKHQFWKDQNDKSKIRWDNHWVSFTKNPDVIGSHYFSGKGLEGFVIVIKSKKALNISWYKTRGFDEQEVVAPMDKNTCVDILPFDEFFVKYGTGNSDYEKNL